MIKQILIISIYCLWAMPFKASAQTLIFGYVEFPPFTYTNSEGKADGFIIDLVDSTFKNAKLDYTAVSLPAIRLKEYLKHGKVDVWVGITTANDFDEVAIVGSRVFNHLALNAYFIGNKPAINKKEQLNNQSIITMLGYSYGGLAEYIKDNSNNITDNKTQSLASAFQMLASKRGDYLLGYGLPAQQYLSSNPINALQYSSIAKLPLYFIVSHQTPNGPKIIKQLEYWMNTQNNLTEPSKHHP